MDSISSRYGAASSARFSTSLGPLQCRGPLDATPNSTSFSVRVPDHAFLSAKGHGYRTSTSTEKVWRSSSRGNSAMEYDVVIVGAGIIGIATAHHILLNTDLSVAVVDAMQPCAGATGAGQGYIWMSHRTPGSPDWALASRSKLLWEKLTNEVKAAGIDPLEAMGWRNTGSLLVASTNEEAEVLQKHVEAVSVAGVPVEYLTAMEAEKREPALSPNHLAGAAFFPEDSQIDARLAMALLLQRVEAISYSGRFKKLFQNPVHGFIRSPLEGRIQGVQTPQGDLYCKKAVVIATGAWSCTFMEKATMQWGLSLTPPVIPRKGHLLVLGAVDNIKLRHGMMEVEYLSHSHSSAQCQASDEDSKASEGSKSTLELSMTATMDQNGNLILGSSREFVGFDIDVQNQVVESIMKRATKFLQGSSYLSLQHALRKGSVRIGLRPFSSDGRPLIGPVENIPGLIFATGHEGSGLCLALATAEMVVNTIQEVEYHVEGSFFSPTGRLLSSRLM